jgi:hypothetical protein
MNTTRQYGAQLTQTTSVSFGSHAISSCSTPRLSSQQKLYIIIVDLDRLNPSLSIVRCISVECRKFLAADCRVGTIFTRVGNPISTHSTRRNADGVHQALPKLENAIRSWFQRKLED